MKYLEKFLLFIVVIFILTVCAIATMLYMIKLLILPEDDMLIESKQEQ